jgi:hypothetical protein
MLKSSKLGTDKVAMNFVLEEEIFYKNLNFN